MLKTIKKNGLIQPIRQAQGRQAHSGLTIVELLVAVAIIAVLAAGLFTVSNYLNKQAQINLTQSTIDTLVAALEQYHDFYGNFPDITVDSDYLNNCNGIERLYYKLSLAPDAKKILNRINSAMIKNVDANESATSAIYPEIVDAWQMPLRYTYEDKDNFPVIESAGPDKDFNTPDDISSK